MPQIIPTKIKGIFSYPEAKQHMKLLMDGMPMSFKREPENAHDANAIAIYVKTADAEIKCGYLSKELAAKLKDKKIAEMKKGLAFDAVIVTIE